MGCLTFTATLIPPAEVSITAENENEFQLSAVRIGSEVFITAETKNTIPVITAESENTDVSITAGLVCQVNLGMYECFYVTDGPLIVENGYLRVKKSAT